MNDAPEPMPSYVGEILDPNWTPDGKIAETVAPPRLEGQPEFPKPGIYFGMDEEEYHAVPACSTSGLKKLSVSNMDYWATSHLNPDKPDVQRDYFDYGKAIHAFVLEGEGAYIDRFAVELDEADYEGQGVITSTDEIKAAIGCFTETVPVRPASGGKQPLIDQLSELAARHERPVDLEGTVAELKERIKEYEEEQPVRPSSRVEDETPEGETFMRTANKADWIKQLLELKPEAMVWDKMTADHRAKHEGKTFITAQQDRRIRISVKMITAHEEISKAFTGGYAEVSIFWYCRKTGAPIKARMDYLKMRTIVDLKSFGNNAGMPIDRAIERTIANYRYNLQHVIYVEAAMEAKRMIREAMEKGEHLCSVINIPDQRAPENYIAIYSWCAKWAAQKEEPGFIFVFQQSGIAPVTRGKIMPTNTVYSVTSRRAEELKRKWVECAQEYATLPWLDIQPIDTIDDEAIPLHSTEL